MATLYGLGVGPGDPELITVKAFRIMKESPVIAYPKKMKGKKAMHSASLMCTSVAWIKKCSALYSR